MRTLIAVAVLLLGVICWSAASDRPSTRAAADGEVNRLLPPRPLDPVSGPPTQGSAQSTENPRQEKLVAEPAVWHDRSGRIEKTAEGRTRFVFDSDDPAMIILENRMLMSMEAINKLASGHAKFRVSGEIMEYNGRNYILIVKAVALPDAQPEAIKAR